MERTPLPLSAGVTRKSGVSSCENYKGLVNAHQGLGVTRAQVEMLGTGTGKDSRPAWSFEHKISPIKVGFQHTRPRLGQERGRRGQRGQRRVGLRLRKCQRKMSLT